MVLERHVIIDVVKNETFSMIIVYIFLNKMAGMQNVSLLFGVVVKTNIPLQLRT